MTYKILNNNLKEVSNLIKKLQSAIPTEDHEAISECAIKLDGMTRTIDICAALRHLRNRMGFTNFWFHPVRNNPRHREQYYFALIAIVSYERWKNVNDTIRMNWESARVSFDRMYGMVKEFAEHGNVYAEYFVPTVPAEADCPHILKSFETLQEKLISVLGQYEKLEKQYTEVSDEYAKKVKELTAIDESRKQIEACYKSLGAFVAADPAQKKDTIGTAAE